MRYRGAITQKQEDRVGVAVGIFFNISFTCDTNHQASFKLCKAEGRPTAACVVTGPTCSQDVSE